MTHERKQEEKKIQANLSQKIDVQQPRAIMANFAATRVISQERYESPKG